MKKIVNRILWGIVVLLLVLVGIYYSYGKKNNFTKADMKFLGVTKEKIIASAQEDIEGNYIDAFTHYYFNKVVKEEDYLKTPEIEEIMDIFLTIEDSEFKYEEAKVSGQSLGGITLEIPIVTMDKKYQYTLSGYRTGAGKYIFDYIEIGVYKEEEDFYDFVDERKTMIVSNAFSSKGIYKDQAYTAFPNITIKNGRKMISGTYYEDGDKTKDYIVLNEDGTFTTKEGGKDAIYHYKVIDYQDSQVHKEYLIDYDFIDPHFDYYTIKFEVVNDHTLVQGDKKYILKQ